MAGARGTCRICVQHSKAGMDATAAQRLVYLAHQGVKVCVGGAGNVKSVHVCCVGVIAAATAAAAAASVAFAADAAATVAATAADADTAATSVLLLTNFSLLCNRCL